MGYEVYLSILEKTWLYYDETTYHSTYLTSSHSHWSNPNSTVHWQKTYPTITDKSTGCPPPTIKKGNFYDTKYCPLNYIIHISQNSKLVTPIWCLGTPATIMMSLISQHILVLPKFCLNLFIHVIHIQICSCTSTCRSVWSIHFPWRIFKLRTYQEISGLILGLHPIRDAVTL